MSHISPLPDLLHDLAIARELMQAGHHDASAAHIDVAMGRIAAALFPAVDDDILNEVNSLPNNDIKAIFRKSAEQASA